MLRSCKPGSLTSGPLLLVYATIAMTVVGCGAESDTVIAGDPAGGSYDCPSPPASAVETSGVSAADRAAGAATELASAHLDLVSGVVACPHERRFTVYRPERGTSLDRSMRDIADRQNVEVRFELTQHSRADVDKLKADVRSRAGLLKERGAELYSLEGNIDDPVQVIVGVLANPEVAREALADFGNRIRVDLVKRNVPLSG